MLAVLRACQGGGYPPDSDRIKMISLKVDSWQAKGMTKRLASSTLEMLRRCRRSFTAGRSWSIAVGLLFLLSLVVPSAALADNAGNWNLDDGSGHRLGVMLYERSNINNPSGLRLRLNAESDGLKLDHARPLLLSDGRGHEWSLANLSKDIMATQGGAIPVGSSQFDARSLNPIPGVEMLLQMTVPSSAGDLSFALSPGQVQTLNTVTEASAGSSTWQRQLFVVDRTSAR